MSSLDRPPRPARSLAAILALAGLGLVSACSQATTSTASASSTLAPLPTAAASGWVDQPVSFQAGGLTIYATFRHRAGSASAMPAVLLIAGSGPTDRDGNSPLISGPVDTLEQIAAWLSADGVASLRYDKLGSGQTGLGPFANRPAAIGIAPFEQEAAAGLRFLAAQPGIDRARLGVIGHSEGALFALLLATGATGGAGPVNGVPLVHALGLFEPLSERYLDLIAIQVDVQLAAARKAGQITAGQASAISLALTRAIAQLRASGTVPTGLPDGLPNVLNSGTALFLSQADRYDPAQLAARLAPGMPVLVTCSNADLQVSCAEVHHLLTGLAQGRAATDFVQLTGVDHVLKQDPTGSAANYGQPRPFSPQLQQALRLFVERYL